MMTTLAQRLRQKLLDLAIRGKLVPQNPKDEPAEKLLARIRRGEFQTGLTGFTGLRDDGRVEVEKCRGRARRPATAAPKNPVNHVNPVKKYPPISDDEKPFAIPPNWTWCRLGEMCDVLDSGRKPITKCDRKSGSYPYYGATGVQDHVDGYLFDEPLLLLGEDGAKWEAGEKSAFIVDGKVWVNNHAHVLRTHACLDRGFVCACLECMDLMRYVTGTTVPKLNQEHMRMIVIPLPPLAEQKRIVAALEGMLKAADAVATGMEKIAALKDKARAKILDLAIRGKLVEQDAADEPAERLLARIRGDLLNTEAQRHGGRGRSSSASHGRATSMKSPPPIIDDEKPFDIPQGWAWCRLGEIFDHHNGKQLNSSDSEGVARQYITTSNVYWDRLELTSLKSMLFTDEEYARCSATKGDLLVCEGGDVGRAAIWDRDFDVGLQNHIHRLRAVVGVDVRFFLFVFWVYKIEGRIQGKGIAIQGLSAKTLHNLPIPLPPLAEQQRIVAKVDEMLAACDSLTREFGSES